MEVAKLMAAEKHVSRSRVQGVQGDGLLRPGSSGRERITVEKLMAAEKHVTRSRIQGAHGDVGGDRMRVGPNGIGMHNYAPIYARHLPDVLTKAGPLVLAETGILTCTGLAMWQHLWPDSHIYGFDWRPDACLSNIPSLQQVGFRNDSVHVNRMDQQDTVGKNVALIESVLGNDRLDIVIDDGLHTPLAGLRTFASFHPFLADKFAYFIEDIPKPQIVHGRWKSVQNGVMQECAYCNITFECPVAARKPECVAVIRRG